VLNYRTSDEWTTGLGYPCSPARSLGVLTPATPQGLTPLSVLNSAETLLTRLSRGTSSLFMPFNGLAAATMSTRPASQF
jgi:hypothetical protein